MRYTARGERIGKRFDEELYKKTDKQAGEAFLEVIKYWYPVLKLEDYKIDALIYYDKEDYENGDDALCSVELEMNLAAHWKKGEFSYQTGQVFKRKTKNLNSDYIPFHIQFNHNLTDCFILSCAEVVRVNAREAEFKTGKDVYFRTPKTLLDFGTENIEDVIYKHVCMLINREDLYKKGYKNINKVETKSIFKAASDIHNVMFKTEKKERKIVNKVEQKHKFHYQLTREERGYKEYLVYYDKQSFLNKEDALYRVIVDKQDVYKTDNSLVLRRPRRILFSTKHITFQHHYYKHEFNQKRYNCATLTAESIIQSHETSENLMQGEQGYYKPLLDWVYKGESEREKYIFEYVCDLTMKSNLKEFGIDNLPKEEVQKVFKWANYVYQRVYGIHKLK